MVLLYFQINLFCLQKYLNKEILFTFQKNKNKKINKSFLANNSMLFLASIKFLQQNRINEKNMKKQHYKSNSHERIKYNLNIYKSTSILNKY